MDSVCVSQLIRWMKRADSAFADVSVAQLFRTAYFHAGGHILSDVQLVQDMAEFAKGKVPLYVSFFIRRKMYPMLVKHSERKRLPLIL